MSGPNTAPSNLSLDELLEIRETTERVSAYLYRRVREHLATLAPILAPGRVLGKHVGSREAAARADETLNELAAKYKQTLGGSFNLKPDLDEEALAGIGSTIHVYPFEYTHEAKGAKASKTVAMTSPVRWVVTYGSEYSLSQFRTQMSTGGDRRVPPLRQFVVNALAFQVVLGRNPLVSQLFGDLRYEIEIAGLPGLEKLPLVNFSVPVPSFRPPDDLLLTATRLSGVPAFIELIEMEALNNIPDPLRLKIESLAQEAA
jgi:hypothetical protein